MSFTDKHHNARVFTIVTALEMTGAIIGGPFMAILFSFSLNFKGVLSGLPFLVSSVSSFRTKIVLLLKLLILT